MNPSVVRTVITTVIVLTGVGSSRAQGTCEPFPQGSDTICEPFTGYNSTSFPNAFGHLSTEEIISSPEFFVTTIALSTITPSCTQNVSTAFCRMFLPQCENGTQIQLCRNVCDEINARCTPVELSELCNVLPYQNDNQTCSLVVQPTVTATTEVTTSAVPKIPTTKQVTVMDEQLDTTTTTEVTTTTALPTTEQAATTVMDAPTTSEQLTTTATTEVTTSAEPKITTTTAPPTTEEATTTVMDEPTTSQQLTTTATTEVTTSAEPKITTKATPPTSEQTTVMDEPTTLAQLETTTTTEVTTSAERKISTTTVPPTTEEATTVIAEPATLEQRETTVTTIAEPKITATTVSPTTRQTGTCEPFPQESQRICGPFTEYNSTSFPNAFGHLSSQQIINSAEFLLVTFALNTITPSCTQNASTAFCRMFLPQCEDGTQIQLCRNDCDEINARCTPVELSSLCEVLPYHNDDPTCSLVLQPTPTAVECPVLTAPVNGALSPAGRRQYQDVVTFTCNPGYSLVGQTSLTCQLNGTWSATPPTCNPNTCPYPVDLVFLMDMDESWRRRGFEDAKTFVQNVVKYFTLGENDTRVGVVTFSSYDDQVTRVKLNENYTRVELLEEIRNIPYHHGGRSHTGLGLNHVHNNSFREENGGRNNTLDFLVVLTDDESFDDVTLPAQLIRDMGITVFVVGVGGESDISQATLEDIAGDPSRVFRLIDYDDLEENVHARAIGENICNVANLCDPHPCDNNATCRLLGIGRTFDCTCNVGFVGNGFTCSAAGCPVLTAPVNGALSPTGRRQYQDGVTFTCNPGYVLNGVAAATCQANVTWSSPVPTCTPVQCPSLTAPANGAVSPTGAVSYPNGVTFTCNPGYVLTGAAAATCQADGTWSSPVPTCTLVQCPARAAPANGAVSPTGAVSYPNSATFTCNSGYVQTGAATATCQADGTWRNPVPTCTHLDECTENMETCPDGSICLNTPGGYRCTYCTPEVAILGGGMAITRSAAFRLTSRFSLGANCTEQLDDVAYRWEALPPAGTRWQALADIVSTKADLLVPSRRLDYGTYMFRLTVTVNETNTGVVVSTTSNTASVSITASSLVAGILGGFRRQVGTGRVTLDAATLSSDPDGVISMSKDLNYRWSCHSTDGSCPVLSGGDDGILTVNLGLGTLHSELTFTVEVSAPSRDAVSASQIVNVVRSTIPLTSIICDTTYGTCGPKINSGEKMRLSVLCSNCLAGPNKYTYNWTLVQTQGSVITTWTDQDWNRNILNDRSQDYISFKAGVFDRQGTYTVTAIVTDSNTTESGSSEYSFTLNEPPSVGTCAVHASDTSEGFFEIRCQGFDDPDLPLRYDFEYTAADVRVASVNSTVYSTNQYLLYSGPASSTPPIRLPAGNPDRNYELEIVIRVTDVFGAFSNTRGTTHVRPPEVIQEFVETVLDNLNVDDVQQTTSSISSVASVLNLADETDVENTTRIQARERMLEILAQVQVLDVQQVKQVAGPVEHVTNKPKELSDESQVKAAETLKTLEEVLTTKSSEVGTEELERVAAHLITGAVNVLEASSESAERKREESQLQNRTTDFEKNEQATTVAFQAIDNLALTMIERKNRDEKPTLVQANEFLMSLARSGCERLGSRLIQTSEETKAYFQIPENTTTKLCVNGTVGSQTYFTPRNPFEYANNARDVRTPVLGLSVLGERQKVLVRNLEEDERVESINPVQNRARLVNGTATSSNSGQISLHSFNTSEPGVALYVRVTPDVNSVDVNNVTLRAYLKRGAVVTPGDYSHNVTLTRTRHTSDGRTVASTQHFTWFLNQSALNIRNKQEMWAIGIQRVATTDKSGRVSDSSVRYTASITAYKCLFFTEATGLWTDNGCEVGPKTTDEQLHCVCDHLTAFAGFVAPNPLDLGRSFTFLLDRSVIVLVTVCVVLALYLVAVFIGRSADLDDERQRQRKAHRQLSETTKGNGYLSHHLWLSVVKFPSGHFTRVQRISCCLSLLMSFMLVNIVFYRGDRDLLSKVTIGDVELALPFSLTSFIIGLESSLIALPINVLIVVLFRYSGARKQPPTSANTFKPKSKESYGARLKGQHVAKFVLPRYLPKVDNAQSEFGAGYTADPTAYIEKLKKEGAFKTVDTRYVIKKEGSKVTVNRKPYRPFPWWCRIVAWLLVAAIVVVCGAFTVLYGNEYGRAKSQSWLFAFLISFLTDVIILQPVKVILVIIFFKLITKKTKVPPETISMMQSRMNAVEEAVWEGRRKKFLHHMLYQDGYVREPASPHSYINTENRSVTWQ